MEVVEFMWDIKTTSAYLRATMAFLLSFFFKVNFFNATGWVGGHINQGPPPNEELKLTFTLGKCLFKLVILTFGSGPLV